MEFRPVQNRDFLSCPKASSYASKQSLMNHYRKRAKVKCVMTSQAMDKAGFSCGRRFHNTPSKHTEHHHHHQHHQQQQQQLKRISRKHHSLNLKIPRQNAMMCSRHKNSVRTNWDKRKTPDRGRGLHAERKETAENNNKLY